MPLVFFHRANFFHRFFVHFLQTHMNNVNIIPPGMVAYLHAERVAHSHKRTCELRKQRNRIDMKWKLKFAGEHIHVQAYGYIAEFRFHLVARSAPYIDSDMDARISRRDEAQNDFQPFFGNGIPFNLENDIRKVQGWIAAIFEENATPLRNPSTPNRSEGINDARIIVLNQQFGECACRNFWRASWMLGLRGFVNISSWMWNTKVFRV